MNIVLFSEKEYIESNVVRLRSRRFKHITQIHRVKVGDQLAVGQLGSLRGTGEVLRLSESFVDLKVTLTDSAPVALPCQLILALPRPPVLKRILISATSLGVKKIFLIQTNRVEKSFWQSSALKPDILKTQLILGLEQSKDTVLPEVYMRKRFKPFVEDELPNLIRKSKGFVAHPQEAQPCPKEFPVPLTLVIGPEGGFIPFEIDKLTACGFNVIHAGCRIFRVETAVPFFLSRIPIS
ncbi:MAG: 16S rRNA (uracil(1498)-N(3))-methyltransferase [Candidatus Omnitrophica bacterium]|nr:16S rRNA (uracil(1498)-N(3))-methyltransferase [Candidatus Omnitrophota bacterium]